MVLKIFLNLPTLVNTTLGSIKDKCYYSHFTEEKKNEALKFHGLPTFTHLVNGLGVTGSDVF